MAQTGFPAYSKTAASNATADSAQNWAEGMASSAVNDSARGGMASLAKWRDDTNGSLVTGGTSTAYTVTTNTGMDALAANYQITFQVNADNGGTTTLNVDSKGAKPLRSAAGVELVAGQLKNGGVYAATYFTSNSGEWIIHSFNPVVLADSQVATAKIADKAVTYAKIQDVTTNRLLGNVSGGAAAPQEITIGAGLLVNSTTLTAPAFPPKGSFSNLSIKVASNTTVTVAADLVTTTDGTNYLTTALSGTINLGTNGAANALDTGTIAQNTWYSIWAIAKSDGTTAGLASTSASSPTLPSGYTYKARIGWVKTVSGSATLYGTWQLGKRASYKVGLAQTSAPIKLTGGSSTGDPSTGSYTSVSISDYVPTTAAEILGSLVSQGGKSIIAPNGSYGAISSTTAPPPVAVNGGSAESITPFSFIVESSNIYWASNANLNYVYISGWVDNI